MVGMVVIGIDPGLTGALARFEAGRLTDIRDIPSTVQTKARKGASVRDLIGGAAAIQHRTLNAPALAALLREWGGYGRIVREHVATRPNQGIVSSGRFMEVVGNIDGVASALGFTVETVAPEVWKRMTGTPTLKKEACLHAAKIFPEWKEHFKRTSIDHNRAEAVLIGWYGVRFTSGSPL